MNNPPRLVSIVTPSFNQGRFLEQTILSVLNQTYPHIEYLVLDGGSTDQSVGIIKKHESKLAYWHSREDRGFADAVSQGFQRSTGEILAYLNSDDLLAPDAVEKAVEALNQRPEAVMIYGNRVCIDEHGQLLYYRPNLPILARSPYIAMSIGQESCFWRREAYFKVGGINTHLQFAIDYDLFSRFARHGNVVHAGAVWGFFRRHESSKTTTQYLTLGKREGAAIQINVWGRRVNRVKWLTVLFLVRFYALCGMWLIREPRWPVSLPPLRRQNVVQRCLVLLRVACVGSRARQKAGNRLEPQ